MRIEYCDNVLIVYLKIKNIDNFEDICRNVIKDIDKYFNIKLRGFYDVTIYADKNYGIVLEFNKEDINAYIDYDKVDIHVKKIDSTFLYEVHDVLNLNIKKFYLYNNRYYVKLNSINNSVIENIRLVYKDTYEVLKKGKIINV